MKKIIKITALFLIVTGILQSKTDSTEDIIYKDGDLEKIVEIIKKSYRKNDTIFDINKTQSTELKFKKLQDNWMQNAKIECRFIYSDIMSGNTASVLTRDCLNTKKKVRFNFIYTFYLKPLDMLYLHKNPWRIDTSKGSKP